MIEAALARIEPLDEAAMAAASAHLDRLTKPTGSLGRLEELAILLAGITGEPAPRLDRRAIVVAAGDHGVAQHGVSAYPTAVTAQMVVNFLAGGAAINVLAAIARANLTVVDLGVATPIPIGPAGPSGGRLVRARIRDGTADMTAGPAMSWTETIQAIETGCRLVDGLRAVGVDIIGIGEMGIGNTTAASALVAALAGEPVELVTGRGSGVDDAGRARKIEAIEKALAVNRPDPADPIAVLAAVGGLEIAGLVGVIVAAAAERIPVVLDGFITGAAALVASSLEAAIAPRLIASHRSVEPGHAIVLARLGLRPILELDLRLGEGTGAALAIGLIDAACRLRDGMATFESAAVSGPT